MDTGPGEDNEKECRVCRGPPEEDRPLFHPCKCCGSIKYVHQDCLLEWIRFSGQNQPKCELCGESFVFTPVYRDGAPSHLPPMEFLGGLLPRAWEYVSLYGRGVLLCLTWLGCLPLVTSLTFDYWTAMLLQEPMNTNFNFSRIWYGFWNGLLECVIIVTVSVGIHHIYEAIMRDMNNVDAHIHTHDLVQQPVPDFGRRELEEEEDLLQAAAANPVPAQQNDQQPEDEAAIMDAEEEHADAQAQPVARIPVQPIVAVVNPNPNPNDFFEADDALLMDFVGFEGPILTSVLRCLKLCVYNMVFVFCFEVCPVLVGRAILESMGVSLAIILQSQTATAPPTDASSSHVIPNETFTFADIATHTHTDTHDHITPALSDWEPFADGPIAIPKDFQAYVHRRAFAIVCGCVGYSAIVCIGVCTYGGYTLLQCAMDARVRRRHFLRASSVVLSSIRWAKVIAVLFVDGVAIPSMLGWLLDIVTLTTCDATLAQRLEFCNKMPFACALLHWVVGFFMMLHVAFCATELRKLLKPDVLRGILPSEIDPDASLIEVIASKSAAHLSKKILLSLCFFVPGVFVCIFLPVRIGHWLCPFASPLKLRFDDMLVELQLPLELLLFHVIVPLALERVHYRTLVRNVEQRFLELSCHVFGTEEILETPLEPQAPVPLLDTLRHVCVCVPFWARILLLCTCATVSCVFVCAWMVHVPLVLGKALLYTVGVSLDHDCYNIAVGVTAAWGGLTALRYVCREVLANHTLVARLRSALRYTVVLVKLVVLSAAWLSIVPLMLGLGLEMAIIVPLRVPLDETPKMPLVQCWALGLVCLKIWVRLVTLGVFGDNIWRQRFQAVRDNGILGVQFFYTVREVLWPMIVQVGDFLFIPYFSGKILVMVLALERDTAVWVFRCGFVWYLALRAAQAATRAIYRAIQKLHDDIRDSRYLLGLELSNRPQQTTVHTQIN